MLKVILERRAQMLSGQHPQRLEKEGSSTAVGSQVGAPPDCTKDVNRSSLI